MQTLEQVLRQYALNPLVQTKIELFEGRKPEVSQDAPPDKLVPMSIEEVRAQARLSSQARQQLQFMTAQELCDETAKIKSGACASQAVTPDIAAVEAGSRQASPFDIACVYCNEPIDSREVHTTMNGPACTNCVEAAAVLRTADSSLANNSVAHTPAVIGKLDIRNPE